MTRIDEEALSLHLEVALTGAAPALLSGLTDVDLRRRSAAAANVARHLAGRLRCFDVRYEEDAGGTSRQSSLFPDDLGPIG